MNGSVHPSVCPSQLFRCLCHRIIMKFSVVVVVVLLFPANNTAMERYNIIQNKLLEATREAIRLIWLVALIMAYKVNKCM